MPDAVVIGAGPNGLVAANLLADAGWSVEVLEEQPEPGGAVRHDHGVSPAYVSDVFSAFYPLAVATPVLTALRLDRYGLRWSHAPSVLAHPLTDGSCASWTVTSTPPPRPRRLRAGTGPPGGDCTTSGRLCAPTPWAPCSPPARPCARRHGHPGHAACPPGPQT